MNWLQHILFRLLLVTLFLSNTNEAFYAQERKSGMSKVREVYDIQNLLDSSVYYSKLDPQKSFEHIEEALELSITSKNKELEAQSYQALGRVNYNLDQYDLSVGYYIKALGLQDVLNDLQVNAILYDLALSYEKAGDTENSLEYFNRYLNYMKKNGDTDKVIHVKQDIARVQTTRKDYLGALNNYNEILEIEQSANKQAGLVETNALIGDIYMKQEKPEKAVTSYKKAVEIADNTEDRLLQLKSRKKLSKGYRQNKDYTNELEVRKQTIDKSDQENQQDEVAEENLEIGKIYIEQEAPEEALSYIQKSIELSEQTGNITTKVDAFQTLSRAYKDQGSYDKALIAYQQYAEITDAIYANREAKLKQNLEIVASINRKLQRIDLLEKDFAINRRTLELVQKEQAFNSKELIVQRRITAVLILVLFALSGASFFVYRSSLQRRKANLLLALKSLRSQMNPHFIFNSLNSVNSYIAQNNERLANKYLSEFSLLMRSVLENSKNDFVPITSEIEIIDLYLKLEHARFQDKFDFTLTIENEIKNSEIVIPPMLIQPYIENAVWHGLRYKEDKGKLIVEMKKEKNSISVQVIDDGIGRKKSAEIKTKHQQKNSSTGLKNTKERLDIINRLYKTKYSVEVSDMDIHNGTGTIVKIRIPYSVTNKE